MPEDYALHLNYPNPFNPSTTIGYDLPETGRVVLVVYTILGQAVRHVVDTQKDAGRHEVILDGRDTEGRLLSSGVYFYRMVVDNGRFEAVQRLLLLK